MCCRIVGLRWPFLFFILGSANMLSYQKANQVLTQLSVPRPTALSKRVVPTAAAGRHKCQMFAVCFCRVRSCTHEYSHFTTSGKSPGQTLRTFGSRAYSIESQRLLCIACFDHQYGKKNWCVKQWHIRNVSARTSKVWPVQLRDIIEDTKAIGGTLAAATVDRMLRTPRDWVMVQESGVPILICQDANLDTTTLDGKAAFAHKAINAQCLKTTCYQRHRDHQ